MLIDIVNVYGDDEQVLPMVGSLEDVASLVHHISIGDVLASASPSGQINHTSTIAGVPTSGVNTVAGNEDTVCLLFVRGQVLAIPTPRTMMSTQEDKKYESRARRVRSTAGYQKNGERTIPAIETKSS